MSALPILLTSLNNPQVERALLQVIGLFETEFSNRIRSYYIEGSFADGSAVGSSDLDLIVVFKEGFLNEREREEAERLGQVCAASSETELDFGFSNEASFTKGGLNPALKLNSLLVYGEEIRDKFELVSIEEWTRDRMHSSYWRTVCLFNRPTPLTRPLDYPIRTDEFFGYCQRMIKLSDGQEVPCTRDLIRLVSWSATALLAYHKKQYVTSKRQCVELYHELLNDEWGELLEDIFTKCRGEWNYLIPEDKAKQQELREICQRTLAFENYFIENYLDFMREEWASGDASVRKWVSDFLQNMPLQDFDIRKV